jgi:hypothetical protein
MASSTGWSPTHVDIEPAFNAFVRSFRNGQLISELMNDPSHMPQNADYLFPDDNVIAELKCLEKNPTEASDWPPRLLKAFNSTGHSFSDLVGYLVRGEPIPKSVKIKLFGWVRNAIRSVVKGGNRQIRASKRELGRQSAKGALLIANDNNYGLASSDMVAVISDAAARLDDSHVDVVVYFTPNVFHRQPGSDIAWVVWDPRYRDENDLQLSAFVNDLGRRWNDFLEVVTGDPYLEREEMPDVAYARQKHATLSPVRALGRKRPR